MSEAELPVTKPIAAWNKPLQADWKALFKALASGVKNGALGKWEELPGTGVEILSSIGLKTTAGERAYLLIRRALTAAIHELIGESAAQHQLVLGDEEDVVERFDWSIEESELRIGRRFFDRPAALSIVEELKAPLWELLVVFTVDQARATTVTNRLGTYFTFHLAQEWRENPSVYAPLQEALDGPFAKAAEREQGWILYDAWLQKQAAAPVFGESFSLRDIYIPLRGYWEKRDPAARDDSLPLKVRAERATDSEPPSGEQPKNRVAVELNEEMSKWLDNPKPSSTIRLLSGGPGSGKSTFAKMLAADVSQKGSRRVLYLPLHLLDVTGDLVASVDRFVSADRFLTANPLHPKSGDSHLLLVFDGLDELSSRGTVGAEVASSFAAEVRATVDRLNAQEADVRVVITGRPVAVDPQRTHFRHPDQLLFVLPYEIPEQEREAYTNPETLAEDQRTRWWQGYGRCVSSDYDGIPEKLDRPDLAEITRQPLLNYLLALSYGRGRIDLTRETSLNEIYADLLDAVYERQWGPGGPHPAVGDLEKEDFERILEEIAVATWHGNGRTTSIGDIKQRFINLGLLQLLDRFSEGAEAGIGRLLLAFYFRGAGRGEMGDPTFEFTHKSFGEYLVARRIVGLVETAHRQLAERRKDYDAGWDEVAALVKWAALTGPTALEMNLLEFLRREVALREDALVQDWQATLAALLSRSLETGLPMERIEPSLTFHEMTRRARNAEEALLAALNACARVSRQRSRVDWPSPTAFGDLVNRLRGQRTGPHKLALACTSFLDSQGAILHLTDLYGADLEAVSLNECSAFLIQFNGASLKRADLREADLQEADLQRANLRGADLQGANLQGANLARARLRGVRLADATLSAAQLEQLDLPRHLIKKIRKEAKIIDAS